jgi:hypothetical protein
MVGRNELLFSREDIRELLIALGARLDGRGIEARLFLVGGAAMALAFSRRRVTRDLDAVFEPKKEITTKPRLLPANAICPKVG